MDIELKAKNFYRPLTKNQICKGSDDVGKVLDRIEMVHGALIAFNDENEFIGVLSSYKTLYKNHTPPGKKVLHAVFQPMIITLDTSLAEIATAMSSSKTYLLPVFEKNKVIGTINALDIVKRMLHDQNLREAVSEQLKSDHPMILDTKAKVKDAYALLRANGISEVIVTDKSGKMVGVVTRSDIKHAFIHPTDKQRFRHDNYRPDDVSFDVEKKKRDDESISGYLSTSIPTTSQNLSSEEIIATLLKNEQQYLVMTDFAQKPTGIISYSNVLEAMGNISPEQNINIVIGKPSLNVLDLEYTHAVGDLHKYIKKVCKRVEIERVELRSSEQKFATGRTTEYALTLQIDPLSGSQFVVHAKAKSYRQSLHVALKLMDKLLEKKLDKIKKHHKKSLSSALSEPLKQMFH